MAYFKRTPLATQMAQQLLNPGVLDQGLRSGLFIAGQRRTGKTTFLRQDLIPALEAQGAIVVYVDLWSDTKTDPAALVNAAVRRTLKEMQAPGADLWDRVKRLKGVDIGAAGFKFAFNLGDVGEPGGTTLAQALTEVVDLAKTDVVLIIDEVQQTLVAESGTQMMLAIKAARDAINPRPNTPGSFIFIGTGSHRAQVAELTRGRNQAFVGATSIPYPTLDGEYVEYLLHELAAQKASVIPSRPVATAAFETMGFRPEEMVRALRILQQENSSQADVVFPAIAQALKTSAADTELRKLEDLGTLAEAIFDQVARAEEAATGLYAADALTEYGRAVGGDVTAIQVQRMTEEMRDANIIMRIAHGAYAVTDPFVRQAWNERRRQLRPSASE
ncbi:MAG TPA: AAA family ATPase [Ramlibacter sp.]|nr:AAA family ATPase [Ramlibacter sp.]